MRNEDFLRIERGGRKGNAEGAEMIMCGMGIFLGFNAEVAKGTRRAQR